MIQRHETTVLLGEGAEARPVVLREITPGQALLFHRAALGVVEGRALDSAAAVADLLVGDVDARLALLEQCSSLGQEVHELGGAAFLGLWRAFEEVNAAFLDELVLRLKRPKAGDAPAPSEQGEASGQKAPGSTSAASAAP
jgi:hypothetical protein